MRTLTIIGVIVVLLLGGSLTSHRYIQTTTQSLEARLETIEDSISAQKWEFAQKELNTAQQRWDKNKLWWSILLDHQELDTIELSMRRLEKYIATQNGSLSLGEVSSLKLLVDNIFSSDKLSLRNIL